MEGEVGEFLTTQIEVECQKLKIEVEDIFITNDACVDLILTLPTDVTISQVLKNVKGLSAQQTFKKYPELKDKCWHSGKLWNGQSMVETIGEAKKMTKRRYIKNKERESNPTRDLQTNEELLDWWRQ